MDDRKAREFAEKTQLHVEDLLQLVRWNGEELRLDHDNGEIRVSRQGIELSAELTDTHAITLLDAGQQALLLELERQCRLSLPCTPQDLLDWYARVNESAPQLDESGALTSDFDDLVELPIAFTNALSGEAEAEDAAPMAEAVEPAQTLCRPAVPAHEIKERFQVKPDALANARWWDRRMREAGRYHITTLRAMPGKGPGAPSLWYPDLVACWLIDKKHMEVNRVVNALRTHFPQCADTADLLGGGSITEV